MEFYPYFPRPYYYTHYRNMQNRNYAKNPQDEQIHKTSPSNSSIQSQARVHNQDRVQNNSKSAENPIFEIFGIRLFFDDILIISLIFFLYNEGVRDNLLFISLILILLS